MNNALAIPNRTEFQDLMDFAGEIVASGLAPSSVKTASQALVIILTGRELNVPPMRALNQIAVIKGKPNVSPELMAALVERDHGPKALIVTDTSDTSCTVSCWKEGWEQRHTVTFTIEDARRAGLVTDDSNYNKYPAAMLRSRAISFACKTHFQASIGGLYTSEELGAVVDEDGTPRPANATPPSQGVDVQRSVLPPSISSDDSGAPEHTQPLSTQDVSTDIVMLDGEGWSGQQIVDASTGEIINESVIVEPKGDDSFVNMFLEELDEAATVERYEEVVKEINDTFASKELPSALAEMVKYHRNVWTGVGKLEQADSPLKVDKIMAVSSKAGLSDDRLTEAASAAMSRLAREAGVDNG